ncbi:MAG: alpha/beta hydrolase [Dehalococcoidia bacterium]
MTKRTLPLVCDGHAVPAILWTPDADGPHPIVVAGHGFGQHKRALFPPSLPRELTARGFALAAIDAPGHGDRQPDGGRDFRAVDAAWRAHWREHGASRIAREYGALIDALADLREIDVSRAGYWGLSLATQYGLGVLAEEPRIRAAVLGLFGMAGPRMAHYAPLAHWPVFFIQQLGDELHAADSVRALFDAIGSADKTLRASPGGHQDVPATVFKAAYEWMAAKLS